MPPAAAAPASSPDQREIFLSPRVVDASAFEQFAGTLRTLVGQASEQDAALRGRLSKSEAVLRELAHSSPAADPTRPPGSLEARLDELSARIERLAAARSQDAAGVARGPHGADRVPDDVWASAEARIAGLVEQATGRIRAAAVEASTAAHDASEAARAEIERARSVVHAARAEYEDSLASWRERIAPLTEQAGLETANLEARLRAIEERIGAYAGPVLRSLSVLCGRAGVLLGRDPALDDGPATGGSLGDLVARAERLEESVRFATGQLESIRADAERAQATLASTLDASAATVEQIARRQQELGRAMLDTVHTTEQARELLESRARQFLEAIESVPPPPGAPAAGSDPAATAPPRRHGRTRGS